MPESASKRAASRSPSRKTKRQRESDVEDDSLKKIVDKDKKYDSEEEGESRKGKSKTNKRLKRKKKDKRRAKSVSSTEEGEASSESGLSESEEYEEENLKEVKVGRYWGGEPPEDIEEDRPSSLANEKDFEVGKRYYEVEPEEKREKSTEPDTEYVVGKRYYDDKPEQSDTDGKKESNKEDTAPPAPVRKTKVDDPLLSRTGGAYIPPAKLRLLQASITDKSSVSYQRIAWEALKKSIHGHINKVNTSNIGIIARLLMKENIVRGRGLLCRSLLQAQAASPTFTNVYASLVSVINSKFPNIGELLMKRVILQFKRGFKRNDKALCISSCQFIAHLVNQQVAHEILALEMLTLLLESPTNDSVEVAVAFLKEIGQKLLELSPKGTNAIFDMLRNILHQGNIEKRVQYMIEVVFQVRKDGFRSFQSVEESLDLVEEEDRYTHILTLDEAVDPEDMLNVFKHDLEYEANENKYKTLKEEIIGGSSSEEESGEEESGEESEGDSSEDEEDEQGEKKDKVTIIDETETNLVALRRTIYLTIQSSLDFEECCHKLLKMEIKPGQESELCHMLLDCCAELRTYEKFFGLLAQRFCQINRSYITPFEEMFAGSYATVHRLDTNKLRNVARFFGHLLFTDAISWNVLQCIRLNEEETTSSSRIFIKILFQELAEYMGLAILNQRLKDPTLQTAMEGLFPRDNPKNTRFAINFFTSIGLGGLTDELREHLKTQPKPSAVQQLVDNLELTSDSSSSSDSSSDSSDSSDSSSDSDEDDDTDDDDNKKKKVQEKKKQTRSAKKPNEKHQRNKDDSDKRTEKIRDNKRDRDNSRERDDDRNKIKNDNNYKESRNRYENDRNKNERRNKVEDDDKNSIKDNKNEKRKDYRSNRYKNGNEKQYKNDDDDSYRKDSDKSRDKNRNRDYKDDRDKNVINNSDRDDYKKNSDKSRDRKRDQYKHGRDEEDDIERSRDKENRKRDADKYRSDKDDKKYREDNKKCRDERGDKYYEERADKYKESRDDKKYREDRDDKKYREDRDDKKYRDDKKHRDDRNVKKNKDVNKYDERDIEKYRDDKDKKYKEKSSRDNEEDRRYREKKICKKNR